MKAIVRARSTTSESPYFPALIQLGPYMDVSYSAQNLVKGVVLLAAVIADSFLNPRNEETAQQGDI